MDAAASPFPSDEMTPPVTKINLVFKHLAPYLELRFWEFATTEHQYIDKVTSVKGRARFSQIVGEIPSFDALERPLLKEELRLRQVSNGRIRYDE